jgi:hypothetical protein
MELAEQYLQEIQGNKYKTIKELPSNIVSDITKINKKNLLTKIYDSGWYWINSDDTNDKNMNLKFISKYDLCPIFSYSNGDYAWYSFSNKKVYDYNHELNTFNDLAAGKRHPKNELWLATPYPVWLQQVINNKSKDAFK